MNRLKRGERGVRHMTNRGVTWGTRARRALLTPMDPATADQTGQNINYLCTEVVWAAMLSTAAAFNATYALRLGASNKMITWLSSLPALIAMLVLIPAARFLESRSNRISWMWASLFTARLGYGLLAFLPWLISSHRAEAVIWLLIAIQIPANFFAAGFNPLLADVIPERDRIWVFARRNILASAVVVVLTFLAGQWLELSGRFRWFTFPVNFQLLYMLGFVGSIVSSSILLKIKVPPSEVPTSAPSGESSKPRAAGIRNMFRVNRDFAVIIFNTLIFNAGAWLVGPLYIIFFIRELGASDAWVGLNTTVANAAVIVGHMLWRRWIRALGNRRALTIAAPLGACYAFLVSLFPNLTAILAWGACVNLIDPGINLSHFNILLKLAPDDHRTSYLAMFSTVMNVGAFILPMLGLALANILGIRTVLLIGGGIRLVGAILFYVHPARVQETEIR
ncbi:MAG: MFS transporter [Anaerolineae bacterium]|nr:MFS transporter [Anaerolineae bacterium]